MQYLVNELVALIGWKQATGLIMLVTVCVPVFLTFCAVSAIDARHRS